MLGANQKQSVQEESWAKFIVSEEEEKENT